MAKKTVITKPAAPKKPAPAGIAAKMFSGKGISNGVKPGKMKGC